MKAWLIEYSDNGRPTWFVGDADLKFTTDASNAMRFARAEDACLFVFQWFIPKAKALGVQGRYFRSKILSRDGWMKRRSESDIRFTEHEWPDSPTHKL